MARYSLPYGTGALSIDIPEECVSGVLAGRGFPKVPLGDAFDDAWQQPFGPIDAVREIEPGQSVVVVIPDHTRAVPTRQIFEHLWEKMRASVSRDQVMLLVATGTHREPTDEELERMLGDLRRRFRVSVHNCDQDLVLAGQSTRGTPIWLNRTVVEADHVITLGHIGVHYFAGYSGGRKNILPGVAGRETIEANHAQLFHPRSGPCIYHGNPVNDEMVEAAQLVKVIFIVDVVLDCDGDVARVVVGEPEAAHAAGRALWDKQHRVTVRDRADVVIAAAGGHPRDINLYQSYKGQYNALRVVRDGGMVLLVAACSDGIGQEVFQEWIERSRNPEDVAEIYKQEGFVLGGHKAVCHCRDVARAELFLVSELPGEQVRRFYMTPLDCPQDLLAFAKQRFGKDYRVHLLPHAAEVFPVIDEH